MPGAQKITFRGNEADYYSCSALKDLKKNDPKAFSELRDGGRIYYTVYHEESDFSEPETIRRGCGLVNRMGFLLSGQYFLEGNYLDLDSEDGDTGTLRDDIREAEMKSI